jgi:hypothetical protein
MNTSTPRPAPTRLRAPAVLSLLAAALFLFAAAGCSRNDDTASAPPLPPPGEPGSPVGKMNPAVQRAQQDFNQQRAERRTRQRSGR